MRHVGFTKTFEEDYSSLPNRFHANWPMSWEHYISNNNGGKLFIATKPGHFLPELMYGNDYAEELLIMDHETVDDYVLSLTTGVNKFKPENLLLYVGSLKRNIVLFSDEHPSFPFIFGNSIHSG